MPLSCDPDGKRLPIKLDLTSNGEFVPVPLDDTNRKADRLAHTWATENARRRGSRSPELHGFRLRCRQRAVGL